MAYIKELQRRGKKMQGNLGDLDTELIQKLHEDFLYKLINIVHKRQEDLLLFHQKNDA